MAEDTQRYPQRHRHRHHVAGRQLGTALALQLQGLLDDGVARLGVGRRSDSAGKVDFEVEHIALLVVETR